MTIKTNKPRSLSELETYYGIDEIAAEHQLRPSQTRRTTYLASLLLFSIIFFLPELVGFFLLR